MSPAGTFGHSQPDVGDGAAWAEVAELRRAFSDAAELWAVRERRYVTRLEELEVGGGGGPEGSRGFGDSWIDGVFGEVSMISHFFSKFDQKLWPFCHILSPPLRSKEIFDSLFFICLFFPFFLFLVCFGLFPKKRHKKRFFF